MGDRSSLTLVSAASGGAGATTLALHLAAAWAAQDAKGGFRNPQGQDPGRSSSKTPLTTVVDLAGGLSDRLALGADARTWADGRDGAAALPVVEGLRALCAPIPFTSPEDPGAVIDSVPEGRVVVDAAPDLLERLVPLASAVVLVVPPSRPGAGRARAHLPVLSGSRIALVCNRTGPGGVAVRLELQRLLGVPFAIDLPCCPSLRDAEDGGAVHTASLSRWWWRVRALARALGR